MSAKRQLLTQAQYDALALSYEWTKVELALAAIQGMPGVQRKADLLGAFGSGDANAAKPLNGQNAIFGMDVIVYEKRPKRHKGEGYVNVYHYVVTTTGRVDFPYCLHGPFPKETLMGHWPQCLDLTPYEN